MPCGAGMVERQGGVTPVAFRRAAVPANHIRLTFVGHSTFVIETPSGTKVVTDYNDFVRPPDLPDIVTMNTGHPTHSTESVPPGVRYVLRGWDPNGGIAHHDVRLNDVRVYNLPTNIDNFGGGLFANSSIFVIEAGGLCIAHLGNLRHVIDEERVARMGRIDIALVPVDRFTTNSFEEILFNLDRIKPRLIIPMHINFLEPAEDFARLAAHRYKSKIHDSDTLIVSRETLPRDTEILIMRMSGSGGGRPAGSPT
jgi:L-ascorbate metabolism protein UlaG (beta-lactamase superfamily)